MSKKTILQLVVIISVVFLIVIAVWAQTQWASSSESESADAVFIVKRRDLIISVVENGEVKARYTTDVKCEVEGYENTITYLISEGTILTCQDVEDGTIIVEMDSSELQNRFTQQDMRFTTAQAAQEEAVSNYDIQIKDNQSSIKDARLKEKFALMELEKYLGKTLTTHILTQYESNSLGDANDLNLDYQVLLDDPNAICQASLKLRQLQNNIYLSEEELSRSDAKLAGSRKLYEKNYITKMEYQADQLNYQRSVISLNDKKSELNLFLNYDLEKESEKLFHDYLVARDMTEKQIKQAQSRLRTAEAKKSSALLSLQREEELLERLRESLNACVIKAPAPGMVLYARDEFSMMPDRRIEPGARVYNRQSIITIPSTNEMAVDVKIHENWINMVEPNQLALVTLDSLPDHTFTGTVFHVDHLPDSSLRWMALNNDLKVYLTEIGLDESHKAIRDGMSAKVEIIIKQLEKVLCVPVQSVANIGDQKVCYVMVSDGSLASRPVEVGLFNNHFIEIKSGLTEGEKVSLTPLCSEQSVEQIEEKKKDMIQKAIDTKNGALPSENSKK